MSAIPETTGTTIIAVCYNDGVVVGADTRTSSGVFVSNRASRKIHPIHDRILACSAGTSADGKVVTEIIRDHCESLFVNSGNYPSVNSVANVAKNILYGNKNSLGTSLIISGYDTEPCVFQITQGGYMNKSHFAVSGSGARYILSYFVDYDPRCGQETAQDFVEKMILRAMTHDGCSGGLVRLATITATGIEEKCVVPRYTP